MIFTTEKLTVRTAGSTDIEAIRAIYNQGIEDRVATLDEEPKSEESIRDWYDAHDDRFAVLVAERANHVVGWASLNLYSHRCAYRGVADLSVYIDRSARWTGVGAALLSAIAGYAKQHDFHKLCCSRCRSTKPVLAFTARWGTAKSGSLPSRVDLMVAFRRHRNGENLEATDSIRLQTQYRPKSDGRSVPTSLRR